MTVIDLRQLLRVRLARASLMVLYTLSAPLDKHFLDRLAHLGYVVSPTFRLYSPSPHEALFSLAS